MSNNMDRSLPTARGTSFMTKKLRECFKLKNGDIKIVPH
jgi:hypothetical protein